MKSDSRGRQRKKTQEAVSVKRLKRPSEKTQEAVSAIPDLTTHSGQPLLPFFLQYNYLILGK